MRIESDWNTWQSALIANSSIEVVEGTNGLGFYHTIDNFIKAAITQIKCSCLSSLIAMVINYALYNWSAQWVFYNIAAEQKLSEIRCLLIKNRITAISRISKYNCTGCSEVNVLLNNLHRHIFSYTGMIASSFWID